MIVLAAALLLAPTPYQGQVLVDLRCRGLDEILVDPRDRGLRRGLALLDERAIEFFKQRESHVSPGAVALAARLFAGPLRITVGVDEPETAGGAPRFYSRLTLPEGSPERAAVMTARVHAALRSLGAAVGDRPDEEGRYHVESEPQRWYGRNGNDFEFHVGRRTAAPESAKAVGLPAGLEPVLSLRVDVGRILAVARQCGGPRLPEGCAELFGRDLRFHYALDEERAYEVLHLPGAAAAARERGLAAEPIPIATLRLLPEDTTWCALGAGDLSGIAALLRDFAAQAGEDPLAALEGATGLDLEGDLLAHFGDSFGVYASRGTGGGGWLSAVAFVEIQDDEGARAGRAKLEALIDSLARSRSGGRMRMRRWGHGRTAFTSLVFPGLPVPVEPTLAMAAGHLFLAATPQAAVAAVEQALDPRRSLLDREDFLAQLPGGAEALEELYGLGFLDTPALLPRGYGLASLAAATLANGVRSSDDEERDPGLVLPPLAELERRALPLVSVARLAGDDLVLVTWKDRSAAVNLTAVLGVVGPVPLFVIGPAFTTGVATYQGAARREARRTTRITVDLRTLDRALRNYAREHGGYPESLDALVQPGDEGEVYLDGDALPRDPWGNEYVYEPPAEDGEPGLTCLGADGEPGGLGRARDYDVRDL